MQPCLVSGIRPWAAQAYTGNPDTGLVDELKLREENGWLQVSGHMNKWTLGR